MKLELEKDEIEAIAKSVAEIILKQLEDHLSYKNKEDPFFTVDELVQYLKVKKSWIYSKVHSNEIPHHKVGNHLRFKKSEIDNFFSCLNQHSFHQG